MYLIFVPMALIAGTTGKIAGKVVDAQNGEPLPGANIIISGTSLGAAADRDGNYVILRVPPGVFTVHASMIGFKKFIVNDVHISIDKTTRLDFSFEGTTIELGEEVEIVAERPLVQIDLTSTSAAISSETIEMLPVENFEDVIGLQAGVIDGHVRGGRHGELAYLIDGIAVNDVFSGSYAVQVENNAIQELELISGTFNAEYGQAMSGIINIVTKEGGENYSGNLEMYVGDYASMHDDIFWNIKSFNPTYSSEFSLSGPVPVLGNKMTFFASGRFYDTEGYIFGKKTFLPTDQSDFLSSDLPEQWLVQAQGQDYTFSEELAEELKEKADAVPMNGNRRLTGQLKLTYKLNPSNKISFESLIQQRDWRDYDHRFRLNPDGDYKREQSGYDNRLSYTRVLNSQTFFTIKAANFYTEYNQNVYDDPFDSRYVSSQRLQDTGANAFLSGGQQMWHFQRSTTTWVGKFELTSQFTKTHEIKFGLEGRKHKLWLHEFEVNPDGEKVIAPLTSFNNNDYLHRPVEFSAYFQDKIELSYMIVNAGLRVDYFEPDGSVPDNFKEPDTSPQTVAKANSQISPRFGLAYPMSDRGVIHVSYGHFFQIPNFQYLYVGPEFDIFPLQGTPSPPPQSELNVVGNADLKPQKTVIYEIGLQQQLTDDLALDLTAYNKDIRNLLGTEVLKTLQGIRYGRYINRDYGNVRGITISLEKRHTAGISASVDYTFQIAKGNASDPNTAFLDQKSDPPRETQKQQVPLNWDRRHQINLMLTVGDLKNYALSFIGRLGTGLPYTPSFQNIQLAVENGG
ncbi:MAG: TonB-dependent receptor, partial [Calditrichaeota bacterium]